MASTSSNEKFSNEKFYTATYRHGVDGKRRVHVPFKWRPVDVNLQFTLIPWRKGAQKVAFISVLPPRVMEELSQKLKAMPYDDPKAQALRRRIGGESDSAMLDSAGRICIPEAMALAADIRKEAVLIGIVDRFELWSPDRYKKVYVLDDELATGVFSLL